MPTLPSRRSSSRIGPVRFNREDSRYDRHVTHWSNHVQRWRGCTDCKIGVTTKSHVFGRGTIPADFMFIGEAPGSSENALGIPFVGPAGKVLDRLLYDALPTLDSFFVTNVILCFPLEGPRSEGKFRQPSREEATNCHDRLMECISLVRPHAVITLGDVAKRYVKENDVRKALVRTHDPLYFFHVRHPSWILRNGGIDSVRYKEEMFSLRKFATFITQEFNHVS